MPTLFFPPSSLPYLSNTAAGIACMPTAIGLATLLRPQTALEIAEFPNSSKQATVQDGKVLDGFLLLFGARDLALGLSMLGMWFILCRGRAGASALGYKTLGISTLIGAGMVVVDGLVSRKVIGGGEWKHWGFLPVQVTVGLGLLGVL